MSSETPATDHATSRRQRIGRYVAFAAVCAYAAMQFRGADPRPWGLAAGWAAATAAALGPVTWLARDRLPPDRLETLARVAFAAGILAISVGLGVALAFEVPFFPYGPGFLAGVAFGATGVLIVERAVVPERLRGMAA